MATALIAKTTSSSTIGKASSLFRISFSFLRNLSTTAPTTSSAANEAADGGAKKPKRKKKKNLIEVAQFLPNWGIGYHMAKSHWNGLSYEITKINLYKVIFNLFYFLALIRLCYFRSCVDLYGFMSIMHLRLFLCVLCPLQF